jgi:hypothetical protein
MKITTALCLLPIFAVTVIAAIGVPLWAPAVAASPQNGWPSLSVGKIERIAFGPCTKQLQHRPDLFIFPGDAVYADANGNTGFSHPVRLGELQGSTGAGEQEMVTCPEPRPQVCTQDYRPVCAKLQDGNFKTYSNGCTACTDPAVAGYREGACE